jgi:hypothetical protein
MYKINCLLLCKGKEVTQPYDETWQTNKQTKMMRLGDNDNLHLKKLRQFTTSPSCQEPLNWCSCHWDTAVVYYLGPLLKVQAQQGEKWRQPGPSPGAAKKCLSIYDV